MTDPYDQEITLARIARRSRNFDVCFAHLERAHVLAQRRARRHFDVHWLMLRAGLARGDRREAIGQVPRMIAALLFSRLWVPAGNSGRARAHALRPMPVPEDLRPLVRRADSSNA